MIRNGEMPMSEIKRVGRKYWWLVLITMFVGLAGALVAASFLPKRYTSQTLVLIDQPTVSPDIVKPVVSEGILQRLASMQGLILSRTRLESIIDKFGLFSQGEDKAVGEDAIERLRKAITLSALEPTVGSAREGRELPGFQINVTLDNPQTAQRVCSEITTMFMEQNAKSQEDKSSSTEKFLAQQLVESKARLDDQDAKLADFKRRYLGSLPDQEQTNLSLLMGMNSQLEASTQGLNRLHQDKAFNETLLSQALANWKQATESGGNPDSLENQLAALQETLTGLQSRYTEEHPDVIKTKGQIEEIKKLIAQEPTTSAGPIPGAKAKKEPAQIQQLRTRIWQDEQDIAELTKRQEKLQGTIGQLQGRVQASPGVEQEYKELTRNYQTALEFYNDLQRKHDQATISQALDHQQEGARFRLLDPPSLPLTPSFPNKLYFGLGGSAGGLMLGVAILYLMVASDRALHTEQDVEVLLRLPVLMAVPTLDRTGKGRLRPVALDKSLGISGT